MFSSGSRSLAGAWHSGSGGGVKMEHAWTSPAPCLLSQLNGLNTIATTEWSELLTAWSSAWQQWRCKWDAPDCHSLPLHHPAHHHYCGRAQTLNSLELGVATVAAVQGVKMGSPRLSPLLCAHMLSLLPTQLSLQW